MRSRFLCPILFSFLFFVPPLQAQEGTDEFDPWAAPELDKQEGTSEAEKPATQTVRPGSYPVAEIDRPYAIEPMVLEPRAAAVLDLLGNDWDNRFGIGLGAGFGVMDNLEAGLSIPMLLAPEVKMGTMGLYGVYDTDFVDFMKLAGRVDILLGLSDAYSATNFAMQASGLGKYKIVDMLAAVLELGLGFGLYDPDESAFLLFFNLGALVQPTEQLALSLTFGVHVLAGMDSTNLPMLVKGQYTLFGDLDLFVEMGFIDLNELGADWFQLIVGAAFRTAL